MKSTFKLLTSIAAFSAIAVASPSSFADDRPRAESSLLGLSPLGSPSYQKFDEYYLVRGKIFSSAIVQNVYEDFGTTTYSLDKKYDLFEAEVATDCSSVNDKMSFIVLGDGKVIYRSPFLTNQDKPLRVSISIKNYQAITLLAQVPFRGGLPRAVWANPKLVRLGQLRPIPVDLPTPPESVESTGQDMVTLVRQSSGPYEVAVNGNPVSFGFVQPMLKNGVLLVPMRPLFEALGATVTFDPARKIIVATRGDREIRMQLDSTRAYLNDRPISLEVPAQSDHGSTLVPLRFISESFDARITFPEIVTDTPDPNTNTPNLLP
ncbi:hypothetical protein EON83_29395 [bacterium]|nr:MAG: hypothetical protein EON83_29395 [bacterium]